MLIRVRGGNSGIKEYLESGRKKDNEYTRDQLDERVTLSGDLDLTNSIIESMDTKGQHYLHVTLSFKEDHIEKETMQNIANEFKEFALKAYHEDEFAFYAEAHLPKIKTAPNELTGELIERKPHIHIVIPQVNLATNRRVDPFGLYKHNEKYIEAFQEITNEKYNLASPKQHVRTEITDGSALISRHKGDMFQVANRVHKEKALGILLNSDVKCMDSFADKLKDSGYNVTIRNQGKENEYINIQSKEEKKGVNLKEPVFLTTFVSMPKEDKIKYLVDEKSKYWQEQSSSYKATEQHRENLNHWNEKRSFELRYVHSQNRAKYKAMDTNQQREFLNKKIKNSYGHDNAHQAQPPSVESINHSLLIAKETLQKTSDNLQKFQQNKKGVENFIKNRALRTAIVKQNQGTLITEFKQTKEKTGSVLEQILHQHKQNSLPEIKQTVEPNAVLESLKRTHGLNVEKYVISTGKDGKPRIACGKRNLNVSDFLTKEIHMTWKDAKSYIEEIQKQQTKEQQKQPLNSIHIGAPTNEKLIEQYKKEKQAIWSDKTLSQEEKTAAISITQMKKVQLDMQAKNLERSPNDQANAMEKGRHLIANAESKYREKNQTQTEGSDRQQQPEKTNTRDWSR